MLISRSMTHGKLINYLNKLLDTKDDEGRCFGVAAMGMNAILARDLKSFDGRFPTIMSVNEEQFNETLDSTNQIRIEYIKQIKEKINGLDSTEIYANKSDKEKIKHVLTSIKEQECWKESQRVTDEKAQWRDSDGYSWLFLAAQTGCLEVVQKLTHYEKYIQPRVFWWAARNGYWQVVEVLLRHGVEVNAKNNLDMTSLIVAAGQGHLEVVQLLLQYGANVDAKDITDRTPLWMAAGARCRKIVELLLQHGAKVDAKDNDDKTPLEVAVEKKRVDVVKELLQHGAKVDAKNSEGKTPLMIATENGHVEIINLLKQHQSCSQSSLSIFAKKRKQVDKGKDFPRKKQLTLN